VRRVIDAGADIFVGQHPHHMQDFDCHQGRLMIMGAGEMLRSYEDPSFAKMDYKHEILYDIRWPVKNQEKKAQQLSINLILVKTTPSACTVGIELDNLSSARKRVRRTTNRAKSLWIRKTV
jgi:poly-gamma-glutamate capsule biosynthesis protein CapA/YwtB (metallophosphatase superfamily)